MQTVSTSYQLQRLCKFNSSAANTPHLCFAADKHFRVLLSALPCLKSTFARRTNGHFLETLKPEILRFIFACSLFHTLSLFAVSLFGFSFLFPLPLLHACLHPKRSKYCFCLIQICDVSTN